MRKLSLVWSLTILAACGTPDTVVEGAADTANAGDAATGQDVEGEDGATADAVQGDAAQGDASDGDGAGGDGSVADAGADGGADTGADTGAQADGDQTDADDPDADNPDAINTDTTDAGAGDGGATDAGGTDGGGTDAGTVTCPGGPGCACVGDDDCKGSVCAAGPSGAKACAKPCQADADCAKGEACVDHKGNKLCLLPHVSWCAPCLSDSDCQVPGASGSACISAGAAGSFCGRPCAADADCAKGATCKEVKGSAGDASKQCVAADPLACACGTWAMATFAKTSCYADGLPGCTAEIACLPAGVPGAPKGGGLSACAPPKAASETCDGDDDDCDGDVDEGSLCDDGNPCTDDSCDGAKGCTYVANAAPCDDGDKCTDKDTCKGGKCSAGAKKTCDDGKPCTTDSCDPKVGCQHADKTGACDDGDKCTEKDTCDGGACAGKAITCDDGNPCTADSCDKAKGCVFKPADGKDCTDGNACTEGDACKGTKCAPGKAKDCDDGKVCTTNTCDPKSGCKTADKAGACDDGSKCTTGDTCTKGACVGLTIKCDDGNPCTVASCDKAQGCVFKAAGSGPCDDGDACTTGDTCVGAKCTSGKPATCDDKDACTKDSCDKKTGCVHAAIAGCGSTKTLLATDFTCGGNDLSKWTLTGTGNVSFAVDASPNPPGFKSKPCSLNANNGKDYSCPAGAKAIEATATSPMLDGAKFIGLALGLKLQLAGTWQASTDDNLDVEVSGDGKTWTKVATLDGPGTGFVEKVVSLAAWKGKKFQVRLRFWTTDCLFNSGTGPFIDDLTIGDIACTNDAACPPGKACTVGACDLKTGQCGTKVAVDGADCDDGNACTAKSTCTKGTCSGPLKSCNDDNPCTNDACDTKTGNCTVSAKADGSFCSDGNYCTNSDKCVSGKCVGTVASNGSYCSDLDVCTNGDKCQDGACKPGPARPDGYSCSDSSPCTVGDACKSGKCQGGAKNPCNDDSPCTKDVCTKVSTFSHKCTVEAAAEGAKCDDGDACTTGGTCAKGVCKPAKDLCDTTKLLDEPFACGAKLSGWSLSPNAPEPKVGWHVDATAADPGFKSPKCSLNLNNGKDFSNGERVVAKALSAEVALPAGARITLSWQSYHDSETSTNYDKRWVVLYAGGKAVRTWRQVNTKGLKAWTLFKQDLTPWAGQKVRIGWLFDSQDKISNTGKGWFVDDVLIVAKKLNAPCAGDATCDDGNPCTADACSGGKCAHSAVKDGSSCDDGDKCTTGDKCAKGACAATAKSCDDNKPCTEDLCQTADAACALIPLAAGTACSGSFGKCATNAACNGTGTCTGADAVDCDDKNSCTTDKCDPATGKCSHTKAATNSTCDDGNKCTWTDRCQADGSCKGTAKTCDDQDACTADSCNTQTGACVYKPIANCGSSALPLPFSEKFKPGTAGLKLWSFTGTSGGPAWAVDTTPNYPTYKSYPASLNFNDGIDYDCPGGKPISTLVGVEGAAQLPKLDFKTALKPKLSFWLSGTWEPGGWDNLDLEASIDGGKSWLKLATYPAGTSKYSFKETTTDLTPLAGKDALLRFRFWTKTCDKNTGYTGPEIDDVLIEDVACKKDLDCDDGKPCTKDTCDTKTGECTNAVTDKAPCDDGDGCTLKDTCDKEVCKGTPKDCDDGDACTLVDQCVKGACSYVAKRDCSDGNPCTDDTCDSKTGKCSNPEFATCPATCLVADNCDDNNPCTTNACVSGKCVFKAGGDGEVCGDGMLCSKGTCAPSTKGWAWRVVGANGFGRHNCALKTDGGVSCWGNNPYGQLGRGSAASKASTAAPVKNLSDAVDIALSQNSTCAVRKTGAVVCWGRNSNGQLGDGTTTNHSLPAPVKGLSDAVGIASTDSTYCALRSDSSVACWGRNVNGELGQGKSYSQLPQSAVPIPVPGLVNVRSLVGGGRHICAVMTNGALWCWGDNGYRQARTTWGDALSPEKKSEMPQCASAAASFLSTAALLPDGTVGVFGRSDNGEFGNGTVSSSSSTQVKIAKITGARALTGTDYTYCAIDKAGLPKCWGRNYYGQVAGNGSKNKVATPVTPKGVSGVISAGGSNSAWCFVKSDGSVICAGSGYYGAVGHGSYSSTTSYVSVKGG